MKPSFRYLAWGVAAAVFLACRVPGALAADTTAKAPVELGIEDCLASASDAAARREQFEVEIIMARADRDLARAGSLPHLNFTPGARFFLEDGGVEPDIQLDLGERLLEVPQNIVRRRIASTRVGVVGHKKTRAECHLRTQVWQAYLGSLRRKEALALSVQALAVAQRTKEQWDAVSAQGRPIEKAKQSATAAAQQARTAFENAESALGEAQRLLGELCGFASTNTVRCRDLPEYGRPLTIPLERCQEWARAHRSDLLAARTEYEASEQAVRLARMSRWPTARLGLGYRGSDVSDSGTREGAYAALAVRLPLWDAGEAAANTRKAEAQRVALRNDMARMESEVVQTVAACYLTLKQAVADYEAAKSTSTPDEDDRALEVRHRYGELTDLERDRRHVALVRGQGDRQTLKLACYEHEARLLEAVEASREEWDGGLIRRAGRNGNEPGDPSRTDAHAP